MVPIPVSLNREVTNNINDNYLLAPTLSSSVVAKLDQKPLARTVTSRVVDSSVLSKVHMTPNLHSQSVSCLVVDHAHSACFQGQPQKKGISPCTQKDKNKRCQRCFLCKSMSFCPTCSKCPQCCPKFGCRGQTAKVLASLAQSGGKSKGGLDFTRGIHATLQNQTTSDPIPGDQEWLCSPRKKQGLVSSSNRPHRQVGSRKGGHQILPGILQPPLSGTKIKSEMETYLGPQPSKSFLETRHFQNGNSGNNKFVPTKGGVGNFAGFQRRLLSYPYQSEIKKVPQVLSGKQSLSIHGSSFRARHSSTGIYQSSQGGETDGSSMGYPDPPVPR